MVSLKTSVNVSTISRAERGLIDPTDDVKAKLSKFFKVPAAELFEKVA